MLKYTDSVYMKFVTFNPNFYTIAILMAVYLKIVFHV